jgi:hypothetical protein
VPRYGAGGLRVAFLHPRSTGRVLIELVESADDGRPTFDTGYMTGVSLDTR